VTNLGRLLAAHVDLVGVGHQVLADVGHFLPVGVVQGDPGAKVTARLELRGAGSVGDLETLEQGPAARHDVFHDWTLA
jgi:hypothetical protein